MQKMVKKITSLFMVAVMACGVFASVPVSAASVTYDKNVVIYLGNTYSYGSNNTVGVPIENISKEVTDVTSSNTKVVSAFAASYWEENKSQELELTGLKKGTAKVTFKEKGKKYTINVTVKKYTNPIKTLRISGVNSGKNVASKYQKKSNTKLTLKKTTSGAKFIIQPQSGWKLTSVSVSNTKLNKTPNTTKKKTYSLGKLEKGKKYSVSLEFLNKKNNGTIHMYFNIK